MPTFPLYVLRRLFAPVVLAAVLTSPLLVHAAWAGTEKASDPDAKALFDAVDRRFLDVKSLSYSVKKISHGKNAQRNEEEWLFRYKKPGSVRVDYHVPHERLIILNAKTLTEYIPELKKALQTDLSGGARSARIVTEVMAHVSVDGLRVGNYEELTKKTVSVKKIRTDSGEAYLIQGDDPRYSFTIDPVKNSILQSEIYDKKGKLVIRTEAFRFIQPCRGFWMPQELHVTYNTGDGFVQTKIFLEDIVVDTDMQEALFEFNAPQGVSVVRNE